MSRRPQIDPREYPLYLRDRDISDGIRSGPYKPVPIEEFSESERADQHSAIQNEEAK